jgi:CO/xanthine dehydrogenase Mo-binding subunit
MADHVLDGGGLANFSASVATVSATAAIGIYDVPKVDVTTVAEHTRGVTAGSMRGYGTLQTVTALETLIDEAAAEAFAPQNWRFNCRARHPRSESRCRCC